MPPFQQIYMCDPPRIYPSLTEYTPLLNIYMRPSQNLSLPYRIYPPFEHLYATLPESNPPSQNTPPFLTTICDPPRIYPFLSEYTPFSTSVNICVTLPESTHLSQNIPLFSIT